MATFFRGLFKNTEFRSTVADIQRPIHLANGHLREVLRAVLDHKVKSKMSSGVLLQETTVKGKELFNSGKECIARVEVGGTFQNQCWRDRGSIQTDHKSLGNLDRMEDAGERMGSGIATLPL